VTWFSSRSSNTNSSSSTDVTPSTSSSLSSSDEILLTVRLDRTTSAIAKLAVTSLQLFHHRRINRQGKGKGKRGFV